LSVVSAATGCFDLFDPKQIKIDQFEISETPLSGQAVNSSLMTISIMAKLKDDPNISNAISLQVQQRNWK
ncbi:hypothetical protein, partial [Klebsiella pneumoniae]